MAIIYIDPTYQGATQNGSKLHPFRAIPQLLSNNEYVIKAGTGLPGTFGVNNISGILISRYGEGDNPILTGSVRCDNKVSGLRVEGLEIQYSPIPINIRSYGGNIKISDCVLHDCDYSVRVRSLNAANQIVSNVLVANNHCYNSKDDMMYLYKVSDLKISGNKIHHANQNWQPPSTDQKAAPGDGMQLILTNKVHITDNDIDRSDSGNKFCIIMSGTIPIEGNYILIDNNTMRLPLKTNQGGAGVYIYDMPNDLALEFVFNELHGNMAGVKFNSNGTFYSNGNKYWGLSESEPMPIGIELQRPNSSFGHSVSDWYQHCTRKTTNTILPI